MKLVNPYGKIVADNLRVASSVAERTKGLIGVSEPFPLLIRTRWGIHTFGVKFPIDCVVLDKNYRVRSIRRSIVPNRIFIWNPKFPIVIELPDGTVNSFDLKTGDVLTLEES